MLTIDLFAVANVYAVIILRHFNWHVISHNSAFRHQVKHTFYFYPRDVVSAVYATATWLGGWLDVHHAPVLYQNG